MTEARMTEETDRTPRHVHSMGPWPFITFRSYVHGGRHMFWRARAHRKGLSQKTSGAGSEPTAGEADALSPRVVPFWRSRAYNWAVGALFAVGSLFFMLGSACALMPAALAPSSTLINAFYFTGSIPFTMAAYLQHFQAANMPRFTPDPHALHMPRRVALIGWHPGDAGWLSTFTQFIGTLAFNASTGNALMTLRGWISLDVAVWMPDLLGSILFLVSGYLAFLEAAGRYWSWQPRDLDWQIVFINLLGCIFFMVSAVMSYVPDGPQSPWVVFVGLLTLFLGALCFFLGGVLTSRESASAAT